MLLNLWLRVDHNQLVLLGTRLFVQQCRLTALFVSTDGVHDQLLIGYHFRVLVNTGQRLAHLLEQLFDPLASNAITLDLARSARLAALQVPERSHVSQEVELRVVLQFTVALETLGFRVIANRSRWTTARGRRTDDPLEHILKLLLSKHR